MEDLQAEEKWQTITFVVFYALMGALLYFLLRYVFSWLLPFILGVVIAALMRPVTLHITKKSRIKEKSAALFVMIFFYLVAIAMISLFMTIIIAQLYELLIQVPDLYEQSIAPLFTRFSDWVYETGKRIAPEMGMEIESFTLAAGDAAQQAAINGSAHLVSWLTAMLMKAPMLALTGIFTVVISILTAMNYHQVGNFVRTLIPKKYAKKIFGLQQFLRDTVLQYLKAYTMIMAITFVELCIGLWLLRFEYVFPVAATIAMVDLLPLIGSGSIIVPWGIVLLASGDMVGGIGLLLLFGVIAVVRNIIEPRIVGQQIGLHPIATITAMYAGLKIAGFGGMLVAPVIILLIRHLYSPHIAQEEV